MDRAALGDHARAGLTERARRWACEQVDAAVIDRGTLEIDDPDRLVDVAAIRVDQTAYLRATATHTTTFATGIADLTSGRPGRLLDVAEGRSGTLLADWLSERDSARRGEIGTASMDPLRGYATALSSQLPDAVQVLDSFTSYASDWPAPMTCAAASIRPRPGTAAHR